MTVNRPWSNVPSSIGQPLPEVEVRVGDDDELLTRSRCLMRGYWKNEAATRAMIDAEGWLHTGDQARVDADGHYTIIGRIKDIIVLNNGEKVPPSDMESAILLDPLLEQVMIVGEGRPTWPRWPSLPTRNTGGRFPPACTSTPRSPIPCTTQGGEGADQTCGAPTQALPGLCPDSRRLHHLELKPWTVDGLFVPTLKVKHNQGARPLSRSGRGDVCRFGAEMIPDIRPARKPMMLGAARLAAGLVVVDVHLVQAAGFALIEQNASGLGNAYASLTAATRPDGVLQSGGIGPAQMATGGGRESDQALCKFGSGGSTAAPLPDAGRHGGDAKPGTGTKFTISHPVTRLALGIGMNTPFRLGTNLIAKLDGADQAVSRK